MERQKLLQAIYEDMELVTQYRCPSNQIRQYLLGVTKFNEFEKWLAERYESDEEITTLELKKMLHDAENILQNLGISKQK